MSKGFIRVSIIAVLLLFLGTGAAIWHNHDAYAKNQPQKKTPEQLMAKYTVKSKQNANPNIRRSRLKQMNIVTEAANVLHVLPIFIIDEMKKGKTLEQIAKAKGLSKAQFLQKMTDYETKTVAAAVKDGIISKEHEKTIKQGQKERLTKSLTMKSMDANEHMAMDMGN